MRVNIANCISRTTSRLKRQPDYLYRPSLRVLNTPIPLSAQNLNVYDTTSSQPTSLAPQQNQEVSTTKSSSAGLPLQHNYELQTATEPKNNIGKPKNRDKITLSLDKVTHQKRYFAVYSPITTKILLPKNTYLDNYVIGELLRLNEASSLS